VTSLTPNCLKHCPYRYAHTRDLHSFPTRRSSDLQRHSPERAGFNGRDAAQMILDDVSAIFAFNQVFDVSVYVEIFWRRFMGLCRSEEHTSELQSRFDLVCRLLLEKKNGPVVGPIV